MDYWKPVFLPATLAGLGDQSDDVKRNAAFCAGVCCEKLRDHIVADYPVVLQALEPLFRIDASSSDSAAACVDNAAACVARMIMASPGSMPMAQVVPALLGLLPLKTDMTENETVYSCLIGLVDGNIPDAMAQKPQLLRVFTEATSPGSKVEDEIQARLKSMILSCHSNRYGRFLKLLSQKYKESTEY